MPYTFFGTNFENPTEGYWYDPQTNQQYPAGMRTPDQILSALLVGGEVSPEEFKTWFESSAGYSRPYQGEDMQGVISGMREQVRQDQVASDKFTNLVEGGILGGGLLALGGLGAGLWGPGAAGASSLGAIPGATSLAEEAAMLGIGDAGVGAGAAGVGAATGGFPPGSFNVADAGTSMTDVSGGLLDAGQGGALDNLTAQIPGEFGYVPSETVAGGGTSLSQPSWVNNLLQSSGEAGVPAVDLESGFNAAASTLGNSGGGILDWFGRVSPDTWVNLGGNVVRSGLGYLGATGAADRQAQAGQDALNAVMAMYQQNRADLAPWREAGVGALGTMRDLTTPGKQLDTALLDPGYAFRQSEGEQALNRAAAARGRYYAPTTLAALAERNQNLATSEFGNVYNRLASLAGLGQTAVGQGVNAGQNTAAQQAGIMQGIGNVRGSGYMGGMNALSTGVGGLLDFYNQQVLLDALRG